MLGYKINGKFINNLENQKNEIINERSTESFQTSGMAASNNKPVDGLKGFTILNNILNLPDSCPFDYMHLIFEGIKSTVYFKIIIYI